MSLIKCVENFSTKNLKLNKVKSDLLILFSLSVSRVSQGAYHENVKVKDHPFKEIFPIWSLSFSANNLLLATATTDNKIHLWCMATYKILISLVGHSDVIWAVQFSPNDRFLLSSSADATLRLWDAENGLPLGLFRLNNFCFCVCWSSKSDLFYGGGTDGQVFCFELKSLILQNNRQALEKMTKIQINQINQPALIFRAHHKSISAVRFYQKTHTLYFLYTCSLDGTFACFNSVGEIQFRIEGHLGKITALEIHPTLPNFVITGGQDGTVRIWNLDDLTESEKEESKTSDFGCNLPHLSLKAHNEEIFSLRFFPSGKFFISSSADTFLKIWNFDGARPTIDLSVKAHEAWVRAAEIDKDETFIVSGSSDGLISLWELPKRFTKGKNLLSAKLLNDMELRDYVNRGVKEILDRDEFEAENTKMNRMKNKIAEFREKFTRENFKEKVTNLKNALKTLTTFRNLAKIKKSKN